MLQQALAGLGPEAFRLYNGYDPKGRPAASIIVLHRPGAFVQDWLAGSAAEHLASGVTQLVRKTLFDDVRQLSARGFDFCGANLPAVATPKAEFGGTLTPFYEVKPVDSRYLAALRLGRAAMRTLVRR